MAPFPLAGHGRHCEVVVAENQCLQFLVFIPEGLRVGEDDRW